MRNIKSTNMRDTIASDLTAKAGGGAGVHCSKSNKIFKFLNTIYFNFIEWNVKNCFVN